MTDAILTKDEPRTEAQKEAEKKKTLKLIELEEANIASLLKKQARYAKEYGKYEKKIEIYEKANKLLFFGHQGKGHLGKHGKWSPNPLQAELFRAFSDPKYKVFTYTGANRIGKTFSAFCLILACMMGRFPWDAPERGHYLWDLFGWEPPIKIRWIGQDWEKHCKTVIIPAIIELLPQSIPFSSKKNNLGIESYWTHLETGSTFEIMSNKMESDLFEGWSGHATFYDEPPKRPIRIACARGLVDYQGREVFSMTLLKEDWIDREVIDAKLEDGTADPDVYSINGEIHNNIGFGITQAGVDQFAKKLTSDEKDARLKGIPSYKQGLILNIRKEHHIKDRIQIPSHWIVDIAIDIHPAKPQYVLFQATDPQNFKHLCFEIVGHGDGEWVADQIIKRIKANNLRVGRIIIDPAAKGDSNNENSTFDKIDNTLARFGFTLETASKDKDQGILELKELLWSKNNMAGMFIFRDLVVAIDQLTHWMIDPDTGKPAKNNDDQCENLYRLSLLGTQWYDAYLEDDQDTVTSDHSQRNSYTGY